MVNPVPIDSGGILNEAFLALELSRPSSFAEGSEETARAAIHLVTARRTILRGTDWSFASELAQLALAEAPAVTDPFLQHLHILPENCLFVRAVHPRGTNWRLDRAGIRADTAETLTIRFTTDITAETQIPEIVRSCIALHLAILMAGKFLTTRTKQEALKIQLQTMLIKAREEDARQASPDSWRYPGSGPDAMWDQEATL